MRKNERKPVRWDVKRFLDDGGRFEVGVLRCVFAADAGDFLGHLPD